MGDLTEEEPQDTNYGLLFCKEYIRRTLFVSLSWSAIVMPYFALTFFGPKILGQIGLDNALLFLAAAYTVVPVAVAVVAYFGYLFSYGIMSITTGIYPSEVFPSSIRALGLG